MIGRDFIATLAEISAYKSQNPTLKLLLTLMNIEHNYKTCVQGFIIFVMLNHFYDLELSLLSIGILQFSLPATFLDPSNHLLCPYFELSGNIGTIHSITAHLLPISSATASRYLLLHFILIEPYFFQEFNHLIYLSLNHLLPLSWSSSEKWDNLKIATGQESDI